MLSNIKLNYLLLKMNRTEWLLKFSLIMFAKKKTLNFNKVNFISCNIKNSYHWIKYQSSMYEKHHDFNAFEVTIRTDVMKS